MDFLNQAMLFLLDNLEMVLGSYALAIVALTVLMRAVLWPLNTAQMKSMKTMQKLQPKMKELQERYKDDPMKMQQELMAFYSENKFNPFSGCLPTLVQIPIFIALYGALMSPDFVLRAGDESFFFVEKLHHTLQTSGGDSLDGRFHVQPNNQFTVGPTFKVRYQGQEQPVDIKLADLYVNDPNKILRTSPKPLIPGEPVRFELLKADLGYDDTNMQRIESVQVAVTDTSSRELEQLTLLPNEERSALTTRVETLPTSSGYNLDVLWLIVIYGALSFGYQKTMTLLNGGAGAQSGPQAVLMKLMPLFFVGFLFFIPIPAGVILYLLVAMLMMLVQNLWLWWQEKQNPETPKKAPAKEVVDIKPARS